MNWMQAVMDAKKTGAMYPGDHLQEGMTMNKQELIEKIAGKRYCSTDTVAMILESIDAEGWLHDPDQVPGRTITEGELSRKLANVPPYADNAVWLRAVLNALGITVVPDPEPTNAEKLAGLLSECMGDVHDDRQSIADFLDARGVKVSGGNDDH